MQNLIIIELAKFLGGKIFDMYYEELKFQIKLKNLFTPK